VALVATEAATNLVKHATGGQVVVRPLVELSGLELLALDTGPGIRNISACLRDGYSTAGSPGTGLGAITRLATAWDIYSAVGTGTALLVRMLPSLSSAGIRVPTDPPPGGCDIGAICIAKPGEEVCGDAWGVVRQSSRSLITVADGLGHGPQAAEAAQAAVHVAQTYATDPPAALLERMHGSLRHTRGAAVAVAAVDHARHEVVFAGIGNIAGALIQGDKAQYLMSHNGIVGHQMRTVHPLSYAWCDTALLVLCSDGLATRWDLTAYPGLARRHPSLIAGVLYRDWTRGRDDVTVVVARVGSHNLSAVEC
jgi:hypothetical protein